MHPATYPETKSNVSKQLNAKLNDELTMENFKTVFNENWKSNTDFKSTLVDFMNDPFKFCSVDNFIDNVVILDKIRLEMNGIEWNRRSMDLYEFFQTSDLKHVDTFFINKVYEFIKTEVQSWVSWEIY